MEKAIWLNEACTTRTKQTKINQARLKKSCNIELTYVDTEFLIECGGRCQCPVVTCGSGIGPASSLLLIAL